MKFYILIQVHFQTYLQRLVFYKYLSNSWSLVHGRIPNFRNNPDCSTNLAQLEEFQRARVIEICPSLAQEHLRLFSLAEGKYLSHDEKLSISY